MKHFKDLSLKFLLVLFILALVSPKLESMIKINSSDDGFDNPPEVSSNSSIGTYIIEGGAYFLDSHSNFLQFLKKIELAGLAGADFRELQWIINRAIYGMKAAKQKYALLKAEADHTPYNLLVIEKLMSFDYEGFQASFGLIPGIFKDVEGYLKNGDIRGVYNRTLSETEEIVGMLSKVKEAVDGGRLPMVSDLWRLNQKYGEALYFGQYVSEVFARIQD
jgi:hypothetical protein